MNPAVHLFAPLALMLPTLHVVEQPREGALPIEPMAQPVAEQVSIQQRVTIRINPRPAPMPLEASMFDNGLGGGREPRIIERRFAKCVPMNTILGIQPVSSSRLLFILRDDRLITAQLSKGCQAREFYSGLILKRSADGQVCVDRDELFSRSGATCQVTGFRQLIQLDD